MKLGVYKRIVELFKETGSVHKAALKAGVAFATAQRVLITEGLWKSELSERINHLKKMGKTVSEIAQELVLSEKCIQAYLPYRRIDK
ncbi:MAG: hypothetical protein K6G60_03725 [Lachnospiraceae bacterium]|nr:hypothetical protein [Lachnospiraceae bacterium]